MAVFLHEQASPNSHFFSFHLCVCVCVCVILKVYIRLAKQFIQVFPYNRKHLINFSANSIYYYMHLLKYS